MRDFNSIQSNSYDLIIIGGGVNGAAAARDAALRGLKTILVDKKDFASGTSSWSTRLIHGGLRYLEYFEFGLVRESLREREGLLQAAPHLVNPLQLTIPIYQGGSRQSWEIFAGMVLYDVLSFDKTLPAHRMLSPKKFRQLFKGVDHEQLTGAAQYFDGQVEYAERLCLETILSAQAAGATTLNYVKVLAVNSEGDRLTSLHCRDELTGEEFNIHGTENAVMLNTAGPWVDKICQQGRQGDRSRDLSEKRLIGGTKGSHIVVDKFPGAPPTALYVEAKTDGRPFFIVPWLGQYLIGTTDFAYDGPLDDIKASNDEIDYLLAEVNRIFPNASLQRGDVRFTYSGVRPLPHAGDKSAGSITRRHILHTHEKSGIKNLISLIGGKLTTFRQVGEELVDAAYRMRGERAPDCPTHGTPLPGAMWGDDARLHQAIADYGDRLSRLTLEHLFTLYGARASEVLALTEDAPDLLEPLSPHLPDIGAQVVYAIETELAYTITDILRRRTTIAMQDNYGFDAAPKVADVLQRHCGWSASACDRSLAEYYAYLRDNCVPDYCVEELMAKSMPLSAIAS